MGVRTLHLVRHGQYLRDPEMLTDLGRAQSACVASRLAREGVVEVVTSTLPRASQTTEALRHALPSARFRRSRLLVEGIPCPPPWPARGEVATRLQSRTDDEWERTRDRLQRATVRFVRPTRGGDQTDVLVGHGNWIRAMICRALELPLEAWWSFDMHHCGLCTLRVGRKRTFLVRFNETGHLPDAMLTME
ncbi:MAG: histidine phosphatase family protein [Myxococcales bacterium]|nr:histidine phosphatase family protein [Myxococcales bacterium]